jgi:radical SAM protein with 4Fe4S-binding SPASM domain
MSDMTPAQYDEVLASLYRIQQKYTGRMLVNAKCAPHYIKTVLENAHLRAEDGERASAGQAASGRSSWSGSPAEALAKAGSSAIRVYSGGAGGCPAGTHYMGIRPNGDVTPCPYLPVFAGSLRKSSLADLWSSSELFSGIRRRSSLGGRCGACEMNAQCGGCRARAYGMTGDLMAEDPLCTHTPGKFAGSPLLALRGADRVGSSSPVRGFGPSTSSRPSRATSRDGERPPLIEYGGGSPTTISWDDAAAERMKRIPAFVRGMVVSAVEESCRKNGIDRVTVEELERIRARMPTPKMFG